MLQGLTWEEAEMFMRFGEDMRLPMWPAGHFVRMVEPGKQDPAGFVGQPFNPTPAEKQDTTWRRA